MHDRELLLGAIGRTAASTTIARRSFSIGAGSYRVASSDCLATAPGSASATSSMPSSAAALTRSPGSCGALGAVGQVHDGEALGDQRIGVGGATA